MRVDLELASLRGLQAVMVSSEPLLLGKAPRNPPNMVFIPVTPPFSDVWLPSVLHLVEQAIIVLTPHILRHVHSQKLNTISSLKCVFVCVIKSFYRIKLFLINTLLKYKGNTLSSPSVTKSATRDGYQPAQ